MERIYNPSTRWRICSGAGSAFEACGSGIGVAGSSIEMGTGSRCATPQLELQPRQDVSRLQTRLCAKTARDQLLLGCSAALQLHLNILPAQIEATRAHLAQRGELI